MKRRCICGCEDFYATIVREKFSDGLVCFSDPCKSRIAERDLTGYIHTLENYIGPFECVDCGRKYMEESDIPAAEYLKTDENAS